MTVTVENTQVYVTPVEAMEKIVSDFFDFPTAHEFKRQMSCVEVEFPCVITGLPCSSQSSAASLLES